jgi:hypothetical protein
MKTRTKLSLAFEGLLDFGRKLVRPINESGLDTAIMSKLRTRSDLLDALDSWVHIPDRKLLPKLRELGTLIQGIYRFNKPVKLYRGINPEARYPVDLMGLATQGAWKNTVIDFSVGDVFTYDGKESPLSFTTDIEIARSFGKVVVEIVLNPSKTPVLCMTEEVSAVVCERRRIQPETQEEVILLPSFNINFTVIEK